MRKERGMAIHGKIYHEACRYGYGAIDVHDSDSSGGETLISGVTPQKLNREFLGCVWKVQTDSLVSCVVSEILGESAHSEELYLYARNTGDLYRKYFKSHIKTAQVLFKNHGTDTERWVTSVHAIRHIKEFIQNDLIHTFQIAAARYQIEFPKGNGNEWYNFSPLDFARCAREYFAYLLEEFKANGLV